MRLSASQDIFLNRLNTKFRAFVAGFGGGKTFVGCLDLLLFLSKHPGYTQGYFAPTYPQIRDIFYPTFCEAAEMLGFNCVVRETNKEVDVYRNGALYGVIICRSMQDPQSIVGFKIARALVDEIDTMSIKKADAAWNKIIARLRLIVPNVVNGVGVTTTPEGYNFVYERFKKDPKSDYSMVQASTYENSKYLPDDYIQSLIDTYPPELAKAYINGEFVNLTQGSVYYCYDKELNDTNETIQLNEPLFIGMDFNVGNMSAVVHVKRDGKPHAVKELIGMLDTPAMCERIANTYRGHRINVYPDASGGNRTTKNAGETDLLLLRQAGFYVYNDAANPRVRDRINAVNRVLSNRDYKISAKNCPIFSESLTQQTYNDSGEPDKTKGHDHSNDAAGYFISYDYAMIRPVTKLNMRF